MSRPQNPIYPSSEFALWTRLINQYNHDPNSSVIIGNNCFNVGYLVEIQKNITNAKVKAFALEYCYNNNANYHEYFGDYADCVFEHCLRTGDWNV